MERLVLGFIALLWLPLAQAGTVYRCVEAGAVSFSDQPCESAEDQAILGYSSGKAQEATEPPTASADGGLDTPMDERIVGRWHWEGQYGNEVRVFLAGGRFSSSGKDDIAKTVGRGTWQLEGRTLIINAKFRNTHRSGDEVTVSNVKRYTVESLNGEELVLHDGHYGHTSRWQRLE